MSNSELLNEMFLDKMQTEEGREKIAGYGADMLKDRIREDGFIGQVFTRKPVTRADLQVSATHQGMVKMVQMAEVRTGAMTASFHAQPEVQFFSAPRFEVGFYRINSKRYEYHEMQMKAYDFDISKTVMGHIANDVSEIEDRQGLLLFETAVQAMQKKANGVALSSSFGDTNTLTAYNVTNTAGFVERGKCKSNDVIANSTAANAAGGVNETLVQPIMKDDITKLRKLFVGRGGQGSRMRPEKALLTEYDILDVNNWSISEVGDDIVKETTVDGYKYKTFQGLKYFKTIKTDILRPGNIYAFAAEEYLGGFMQFGKLTFYTDRERDKYSFEAWADIGMYIGNVAGVRKLETYAGSVDVKTGTSNATFAADYLPVAESDLGQLNNLIEEGGSYPQVTVY
jgi:hypothetical protein